MKRTVGYMAFRRALSINFLPRAKLFFFIRIWRLKFAQFKEYFKNTAEAKILKRTDIILC